MYAADNGSPSALTSTATVTVDIEDTNDSPPRIFSVSGCNDLGSSYAGGYFECRIAESDTPGERFVAHITPKDPDEEPVPSPPGTGVRTGPRALFWLEDASPSLQTMACSIREASGNVNVGVSGARGNANGNAIFYVTKDGSLYANGSLDREKCTSYMLRVHLRDLELPHLESTALFRIILDDVNDNAPVFLLPNASDPTRALQVSFQQPPGSIVGRVLATDADDGANALISYRLYSYGSSNSKSELQPPFSVQPERGTLFVSSSLEASVNAMLHLRVEACDRGRPVPLCRNDHLFVHVLNIPPAHNNVQEQQRLLPEDGGHGVADGTANMKAVQERSDELKVLLVLAAGLFSIALLLAVGVIILCARRHIFARSHRRQDKGTCLEC